MILEVAILNIRPGQANEFEAAFKQASPIIAATYYHPALNNRAE